VPDAVLITPSSFGAHGLQPSASLRQAGLEVYTNPLGRTLTEGEVARLLQQHQPAGLIAGLEPLTASVLQGAAAHLKVISRCGTGLDTVDMATAAVLGIVVYNTPEAPAQAVAELTLGLILDGIRGIARADRSVRAGRWEKPPGFLLSELTVGVIGLGRIGKRVAQLVRAMDAPVLASDVAPDHAWARAHGVEMVSQEALLQRADVVTLHAGASEGRPLLGATELRLMKPGSYLVNTSRGSAVDEPALLDALRTGQLRGAAIDTFGREPYDGPLRALDQVVLTPHIGSYARAARVAMEREAAENLLRGLRERGVLAG